MQKIQKSKNLKTRVNQLKESDKVVYNKMQTSCPELPPIVEKFTNLENLVSKGKNSKPESLILKTLVSNGNNQNSKVSFKESKKSKKILSKKSKEIIVNDKKVLKKPEPLNAKQTLLLESLVDFYTNENNKKLIIPIVKQETTISLRLLDWLVTNYSKKHSVHYEIGNKTTTGYIPSNKNFNLWLDYKNQLKSFSKRTFDPFCRRQRIFFNTTDNSVTLLAPQEHAIYNERSDGIVTTVGQLNFFQWAITNHVIDYAFENLTEIESDMLRSADQRASKKGSRVRRQLSKNNHSARSQELKVVIQFS